jgi:hypothetical protein
MVHQYRNRRVGVPEANAPQETGQIQRYQSIQTHFDDLAGQQC